MKLLRFFKVFYMVGWRMLLFGVVVFLFFPSSLKAYLLLLLVVPLLLSIVLVFVLGRTILVFPLFRLVALKNPFPSDAEMVAKWKAAVEKDPTLQFVQQPWEKPRVKADLTAEQHEVLKQEYIKAFDPVFQRLKDSQTTKLYEVEGEPGLLATDRQRQRDALYEEAELETRQALEERFKFEAAGEFGFEPACEQAHRAEEFRTHDSVTSASERRAIYDRYTRYVNEAMWSAPEWKLAKVKALIDEAFRHREGQKSGRWSTPPEPDLKNAVMKNYRMLRSQQADHVIQRYTLEEMWLSWGEHLIREIYTSEPTTREMAHRDAIRVLTDEFGLDTSSDTEKIIERFKY